MKFDAVQHCVAAHHEPEKHKLIQAQHYSRSASILTLLASGSVSLQLADTAVVCAGAMTPFSEAYLATCVVKVYTCWHDVA